LVSICLNFSLSAQVKDTTHTDTTAVDGVKPAPVTPKELPTVLTAKFVQRDVIIKQEDILTDVISVINYSDSPVDFTINVNVPFSWTDISDAGSHHLNPGDSIFIPIRIMPASYIKGGTEYVINVFLLSPTGGQIATDYFFAHTQKISKWFLTVLPENRIYFLSHCDTASFQVSLANNGNHQEDIILNLQNLKKQGFLTDTTGRILHTNYYNVQVNPQEDTTFSFKMKYTGDERNFKNVDLEGYTGIDNMDPKTFSVWVSAQDARKTDSLQYVQSKDVTFVKLNDQTWANPFSGEVFPLTVDMNVYNILGNQPIMNLNLHGDAFLDNEAHLVYSANMYYTTYFLQNNYFNGASIYAGYFDKYGNDIQVGQIGMPYSYGISLGGWGVEGDYHLDQQNIIGGIVVDGYNNYSTGASAWYKHRFLHFSPLLDKELFVTSAGIIEDNSNRITTYFISQSGGLSITNTQHLSFYATGLDKDYYSGLHPTTFFGGVFTLGYNGSFMQRRLVISDYITKASYDTNAYDKNRLYLTNTILYQLTAKWRLQLQDVYYSYPTPIYTITPTSYSLSNSLYFLHATSRNAPYIFYNVFYSDNLGLDYFGVGDRYSYYNRENNFMIQAGI